MIRLEQAIVVEGKYDKIKLGQIFDAIIVTTDGFGIFNDKEKLEYIKRLAREKGIIIFTDPDGAGLIIRNYFKGTINEGRVFHAYIPDIVGKERRKAAPGKAGLLGVEGVEDQLIIKAILSSGVDTIGENCQKEPITKGDMYLLGLSGGKDSAARRRKLAQMMQLPSNISANGLLDAVNALYTKKELEQMAGEL